MGVILPVARNWLASSRAAAKVMFFSAVPALPSAPGSLPPCPASIKTTHFRGRGFGAASAAVAGLLAWRAGFDFGGGMVNGLTVFTRSASLTIARSVTALL